MLSMMVPMVTFVIALCVCSMDSSDSMVYYQVLPSDVLECRVCKGQLINR